MSYIQLAWSAVLYSKGLDHDILGNVEKDIISYQKYGNILLCGDFDVRVASEIVFIVQDSNFYTHQSYVRDEKLDSRGRDLLDLCISNQIRILNGRVLGDTFGIYTCHTPNGTSTVDYRYVLVCEDILNQILYIKVCNFIHVPTLAGCHCQQSIVLILIILI